MPQITQIQMRRDTEANWTATNPVLAAGEWAWSTDVSNAKVGDGATAWNALPYIWLKVAGGVMTGNLDLDGNDLIIDADGDTYIHETADDVATVVVGGTPVASFTTTGITIPTGFDLTITDAPVATTDAVNKSYVDALVNGLSWKDKVRAASTAALTLATGFAAGQVIDGVTLALNDRILVKNQASAIENGIYIVTAGAPTRATDLAAGSGAANASVFVAEGTVNGDLAYTCTSDAGSDVVGTNNLTWANFASAVAATFTGLTDTPANFTGAALQFARVNAGATALEFTNVVDGGTA